MKKSRPSKTRAKTRRPRTAKQTTRGQAKSQRIKDRRGRPTRTRRDRAAVQKALRRGRRSENRILKRLGLKPNRKNAKTFSRTDPKTGKTVRTRPDAIRRSGRLVEVKDTKRVNFSPQLRTQAAVSKRKPELHTGKHTKVSRDVRRNFKVVRHKDLGPRRPW